MNAKQDMVAQIMKLHRCENCPMRWRAAAEPRSLLARIHRWHTTWWPGWKIYQAELRIPGAKATRTVY